MSRSALLVVASMMILGPVFADDGAATGEVDLSSVAIRETNGPVMVKVATFLDQEGAADALAVAKELRERHKIPAYVYKFKTQLDIQRPSDDSIKAFTEQYKVRPRVYKYQNPPPPNYVVLAGDFASMEDRDAQKLLKQIRKLKIEAMPESMREHQRVTTMLAFNPLAPRPRGETMDKETAAMLLALNQNEKRSVYNLPSTYTLQVAQFGGASAVVGDKKSRGFLEFPTKTKYNLKIAAENAIILCEALCQSGIEAYVFHGKYASIVCVGGYDSPADAKLEADLARLRETQIGKFKLEPKLIIKPVPPFVEGAAAN